MDKVWNSLVQKLESQLLIYKELFALSEQKQPILVKGAVKELEKMTKEEEILIIQVGKVEEERSTLARELANHFLIPVDEFKGEVMLNQAPDEIKESLRRTVLEIREVLDRLSVLNKMNNELIRNSLAFVDFSMSILTGESNKPAYGELDPQQKRSLAKIFDRKI